MRLNRIEKELMIRYIDIYVNSLKMDKRTAKQAVKQNIIEAKRNAIKEGVYNLPPDFWKEIFRMEKENDDNFWTKYYKKAREDGVKDEDIIYCWETYPAERYLVKEMQDLININAFLTAFDKYKSEDKATEIVRKTFPTYGNPNIENEYGTEEDNALPGELIPKVTKLLSTSDAPKLRKEASKFSSFNAFVRYLAKEDRLGKI